MGKDQLDKLVKERKRSKLILGTIVVLIVIAEVFRYFFDKG